MKKRILGILGLFLPLLLFSTSCDTPRKFAYMQDVELAKRYVVQHNDVVVVSPGDRISIFVGSAFPELAAPFNGYGFDSSSPVASINKTASNQSQQEIKEQGASGYLVDSRGTINFPILGRVQVGGKTIGQITELLEQQIIASKYLTDPRVDVRLASYKIYMLGAVAGQGRGNIPSAQDIQQGSMFTRISNLKGGVLRIHDLNRINILEAIAMAGDLPENAEVNKIKVIRKDGDAYVTYALNMRSADIYNSPAFYLQPNDIVYVQPRYRRTESIDRAIQLSGYAFSTVSSVAALLAILKLQK